MRPSFGCCQSAKGRPHLKRLVAQAGIDGFLLQECEQMLSNTSLTIQQISIQMGFTSQIAFAKFFKARRGCAPTAYREGRFLCP